MSTGFGVTATIKKVSGSDPVYLQKQGALKTLRFQSSLLFISEKNDTFRRGKAGVWIYYCVLTSQFPKLFLCVFVI
jgi:hypothetical protein